jgi:hypothetical protein
LKLEDGHNPGTFIGDPANLSDEMPQGACIRGITNLSSFMLDITQVDINGKKKSLSLDVGVTNILVVDGFHDQAVEGRWSAKCTHSFSPEELPQQIRLQIRWQAPILQQRMIEAL